MGQTDEKARRVKYLRALEKFAKSSIAGLKREDFDDVAFRARVAKNTEILGKLEPVYLDQPYSKQLEIFVNLCIAGGAREELIKAANLLDRLKNQKSYKKQKHKKNYKDED